MSIFTKTAHRVEEHTPEEINAGIREMTKARIARFAAAPESELRQRLEELEYEWDVERALEANAAGVILTSVMLGRAVNKGFFALAGVAGAFLLQHALSGWCPPVSLYRRLGVRTSREIEHERSALLTALRSRTQAEEGWAESI
jgi:hypothetical protein